MMDISFVFWYWWVIACALFMIEIFLPGAFFLWAGFSAVVMGFITWFYQDMGMPSQLIIFSMNAVLSVYLWKKMRIKEKHKKTSLNNRLQYLVGQRFPVSETIENGRGAVTIAGTRWGVIGEDAEKGQVVIITGHENGHLKVQKEASSPNPNDSKDSDSS